jgi:hypothetical protein
MDLIPPDIGTKSACLMCIKAALRGGDMMRFTRRNSPMLTRRRFIQASGGLALAASPLGAPFVIAQPARLKVGLMLPYMLTIGRALMTNPEMLIRISGLTSPP